ncbi:hypothetical protein NKH82_33715 [Mesorhizobium sp. M0915]|uniref:hypothetical protein n=1 Tax=Mesorhizobium sp. M0915 TaxID=2957027 RepID=UPI0033364465
MAMAIRSGVEKLLFDRRMDLRRAFVLGTHARTQQQQLTLGRCARHGAYLLKRADTLVVAPVRHGAVPRSQKRTGKIQFTRGHPNRVQLGRELIAITRTTLAYLKQASERWP